MSTVNTVADTMGRLLSQTIGVGITSTFGGSASSADNGWTLTYPAAAAEDRREIIQFDPEQFLRCLCGIAAMLGDDVANVGSIAEGKIIDVRYDHFTGMIDVAVSHSKAPVWGRGCEPPRRALR